MKKIFLLAASFAGVLSSWAIIARTTPDNHAWASFKNKLGDELLVLSDTDSVRIDKSQIPDYVGDRRGDPFSSHISPSPFFLSNPSNYGIKVELDTSGKFYTVYEQIGAVEYRPVSTISYEDYQKYKFQEMTRNYWRASGGAAVTTDTLASAPKRLIPLVSIGPMGERLFGGKNVDLRPNGTVVLDFGGQSARTYNPTMNARAQKTGGFIFDQQITLSLTGKIGEKVQVNANWDTKRAFQFEDQFKIGYSAFEEDIIHDMQVGNVSMPVSNSLISGAQNLFGVRTKMRFGKLWINAVAANERGTIETMIIKGGGQGRKFEIRAHEYEYNKHFFLSQFFKDNFEFALRTAPLTTSGVKVNRVEVYVTNNVNNTQTQRNFVTFLDMAEPKPFSKKINPAAGAGIFTDNAANDLQTKLAGVTRTDEAINTTLSVAPFNLERGTDFQTITSARKLNTDEFEFNADLGFISLKTPLRNDQALAVSYEYTSLSDNKRHLVGELSDSYQNLPADAYVFLKMLRPATIRTELPTWDLMMKNIYSLQQGQIDQAKFALKVYYRDDASGLDNPSLHEGVRTKDIPLVRLFKADKYNPNGDPSPDGNFDYLRGITINEMQGRIMFPVVEPFGKTLDSLLRSEPELASKYVFNTLYKSTQADAALDRTRNKFFIKGSVQSAMAGEIMLPGISIAPGSVTVRAGTGSLMEGTDYSVDYQMGVVKILNTGVLASSKEIRIQYEKADLLSFQPRNLTGIDLEYNFSKKLTLTGTLMHLGEKPILSRMPLGAEPINNTIWGFGAKYKSESLLLTKIIDKLPLISTKQPSNIDFRGEYAQLIPGVAPLVNAQTDKGGVSYLDDFESTESSYDLSHNIAKWVLASTPRRIVPNPDLLTSPLEYGYRRAKIAWYSIDNAFYTQGAGVRGRPANINPEDMKHNYARQIPFDEINKNRDPANFNPNEIPLEVVYYPQERGPYNYNPALTDDGKLAGDPKRNFGGMTMPITSDVDFDNINIQYMEFWVMDPFLKGKFSQIEGKENTTGGKLYFNLGNISEDVIRDGKHFFENGLPSDATQAEISAWGTRVPNQPFISNNFVADEAARSVQDVGFDGLSNEAERETFKNYVAAVPAGARAIVTKDPSADDFQHFFGEEHDSGDHKIIRRYKGFNGLDGNSPISPATDEVPKSNTSRPDNEDLNADNTLSDLDQYFEYEVDLKKGMDVGDRYIINKTFVTAPNGDKSTWYQVRIPIRDSRRVNINKLEGFKSIRFLRMYLSGWQEPVALRLAQFALVGSQWRPYEGSLLSGDLGSQMEPYDPDFTVTNVNIFENGQFDGTNTPYTVPPGFKQDVDVSSTLNVRLNENSLQLNVNSLKDQDSRAAFRNVVLDFLNYKRLKMEIHAESGNATKNGELQAFIRMGTDFTENYYEIAVPLEFTTKGSTSDVSIWPLANKIDIDLDALYNTKLARNKNGVSTQVPYSQTVGNYTITVRGNPDLSSVQTAMLGIRNPKSDDALPKSAKVWFNELRVTEYDSNKGWAANASLNAQLADLATISSSIQHTTVGFGGIQDKIAQRSRNNTTGYNLSANIKLDKFYLHRIGISLPIFLDYERNTVTPFYDPLDPDMELSKSVEKFGSDEARKKAYLDLVVAETTRRTFSLMDMRKSKVKADAKSYLWDVENLTLGGTYSDEMSRNMQTEAYVLRQWKANLGYAYANQSEPKMPFKNSIGLSAPMFKFIKDFAFSPLPSDLSIRGDLDRRFIKTQLRNVDLTTAGIDPMFEKTFRFNRNYAFNWPITNRLGLGYMASTYAIVDEPDGDINTKEKQDQVLNNLKGFGRMKNFDQAVTANYVLPLEDIPALDWLGADARYKGGYTWTAAPLGLDSLGNYMQNNAEIGLNGKMDLLKLYNKSLFLKSVNTPVRKSKTLVYEDLEIKRERLNVKLSKLNEKLRIEEEKAAAKAAKDAEKAANDSTGNAVTEQPATADNKALTDKIAQVQESIQKVEEEINDRRTKNIQPAGHGLRNGVLGLLMSVKTINLSFTQNQGTYLPGYMGTPKFFGMDAGFQSPSLPFLLGSQDMAFRNQAAADGWFSKSVFQNKEMTQTAGEQINFRATVEPIREVKIQIDAKRQRTNNYSEVFRFNGNSFEQQSPLRAGNYSISFLSINTAFSRSKQNAEVDISPLFENFERYAATIKTRLDNQNNSSGEYNAGSQDVLIPAFIAAYSGKNPETVSLSAFPKMPMPNWRLTYAGLTKIEALKNKFKQFTVNHAYSSTYTVGSYASSQLYGNKFVDLSVNETNLPLPTVIDPISGGFAPVFVMNQISISEQFSPLIGINFRTQKNFEVKIDYKTRRDLALNLFNAQVTELNSNDLVFDFGYTKAGVKLPFAIQGMKRTLENDLSFRMAVSVRDTKTTQRKMGEDNIVTGGALNFQFKPTLSYVINQRTNMQMYFERTVNDPKTGSPYKRTTTAFGIQLRFSIAQ